MMKTVRFERFGGPEVLQLVDVSEPHAGPGQIRIAVRAAGVNPSDWKRRKGLMDEGLPQTLGYEAAGVVDELGDGVTDIALGDRAFASASKGRPRPRWRCCPTTLRSHLRSTSPTLPRCRPPSRRPLAHLT